MKKNLLKVVLLFAPLIIFGQNFVGFTADNYSGIHGVLANPANVVDSRYRFDLNLVSLSAFAGNDYAKINIFEAFEEDYEFDSDRILTLSDDNNALLNIDALGPSFMFNINKNNAIGITSRLRNFTSINNIKGSVIELFDEKLDSQSPINIFAINATATSHLWSEYGLTYGRVILNNEQHFFKAGITLKYLQGFGYASITTTNVEVDYDPLVVNTTSVVDGQFTGNGTAEYSHSNNLNYLDDDTDTEEDDDDDDDDDFNYTLQSEGVGFDLGFIYEWRPNFEEYRTKDSEGNPVDLKNKNKYYLKAGLSVTDIGRLSYDDAFSSRYNFEGIEISRQIIEEGDFEDEIEPLLNPTESSDSKKITLPAALHVNIDWNAYKKLYVNINTDLSLINQDKDNANRIANSLSISPRLETRWASLYSPLTIRQYGDFIWGAGVRLGPIFVGSGSVLSNVFGTSKTADVYAGLKLPIYRGKLRDRDNDGVYDKYDQCPKEAGSANNNGCPQPEVEEIVELDTDNDGVLDSIDECPNEYGVITNRGCPKIEPKIVDSDNDGIEDSKDACPDKFGLRANKGCPVITNLNNDVEKAKEVTKTINKFAKTINFQSGQTKFTSETFSSLTSILGILKKYPDSNFEINGYTDSVGPDNSNFNLSQERAYSVLSYFVEKGIDSNRLKAVGHGEESPIADNSTKEGRAINRRVEISLVK